MQPPVPPLPIHSSLPPPTLLTPSSHPASTRESGVNHRHHLLSRRKARGGAPTAGVHGAYLAVRRRFPRCDSRPARCDRRSRSQSLFEAVPNGQDASQFARIRPALLQESVRQPRVDSFSPCAESPACHVTLLLKRGEENTCHCRKISTGLLRRSRRSRWRRRRR